MRRRLFLVSRKLDLVDIKDVTSSRGRWSCVASKAPNAALILQPPWIKIDKLFAVEEVAIDCRKMYYHIHREIKITFFVGGFFSVVPCE